jgi:hypothetical protein
MRTKYMEYSVLLEQCTDSFRTKYTIIEILRCRVLFWVGFSSMHGMVPTGIPRVYFYFLLHGNEFRVVFSSAEWFGTEFREFASNLVPWNGIPSCVLFRRRVGTELWEFASIFVPRNGIPSYFLFRGRVRNGIPRFSVPRNNRNSVGNNHLFRLFRLPRNYFFVGNSQPYSWNWVGTKYGIELALSHECLF